MPGFLSFNGAGKKIAAFATFVAGHAMAQSSNDTNHSSSTGSVASRPYQLGIGYVILITAAFVTVCGIAGCVANRYLPKYREVERQQPPHLGTSELATIDEEKEEKTYHRDFDPNAVPAQPTPGAHAAAARPLTATRQLTV